MEITSNIIEPRIIRIRDIQVMLDSDLAVLFSVETKRLNEQVKRNSNRFPDMFMFQLNETEWNHLRSQIATAKRRTAPYVFTEHGVAMLASVLNSVIAIEMSIQIIQAFVSMRKSLNNWQGVFQRLDNVELKQASMEKVLQALEKEHMPQQGIFFEGQLFDAHVFASNLIKQATRSVTLIDNYVDENTLLLLSKRRKWVACKLYAKPKATLLKDLEKHNRQYPPIEFVENQGSHDRFLILDDTKLYHLGASLKDLGKACFAFSRMDDLLPILTRGLMDETNDVR